MIIKGACRTNGSQLGSYLGNYLFSEKNHRVEMIELRGSSHRGLTNALASWEAEAERTRCKKPLWHAQLRTPGHEHLTREQQVEAVNILERQLGFQGQPRAIVIHENEEGHQHIHVVWSRIDRTTGKARRDAFTHKKNVAAAREIEERFGLQNVASPEFKNDDKSRPKEERRQEGKKAADRREYQKAKRTKLDPTERKKTITKLWHEADSGKAFRAALQDAGYILARGDNRNFVVVDKAGDIHSLARQVTTKGVLKEQIDARFADLDPASVPKAAHVQQQMRQAWREREQEQRQAASEAEESATAHKGGDQKTAGSGPDKESSPEIDGDSLDPSAILAGITQGKSTFTKSDLHYEIGKRLEKSAIPRDSKQVGRIATAVEDLNDFIELGKDNVGRTRYTSRDMLETELSMRDSSDVLVGRQVHGVFNKVRDASPRAATLGIEQREAFEHVTSAPALSIVIGYAGTGKSHMLGAANEAWQAAGYRVRGVALSGMAAQSLQEGSNINSRTLASLFMAMDKLPEQEQKLAAMDRRIADWTGQSFKQRQVRFEMQANRDLFASRVDAIRFTDRDVIVLDEAAMVGSKQLGRLLAEAEKAKAKVVLVGDAEQLQAIEAGGGFRCLTERHGAVKISEIRRQKEEWAKQATKDFGDGFTSEALEAYRAKGHTYELTDHANARTRIVADWTASRQANPNDTHLMLAFTRNDVATLNEQAREAYKKEGRLGIDEAVHTEAGDQTFARGDRLYFLQNDTRLKVKNGSLGTVEKIERFQMQDYHRMTVKLDNGETVQFSTADYNKFAHGYSATIHKSQGATANRAHVLASQFMDRHATYVAMSRHIDQVDMYYAKTEFKDFDRLVWSLSRDRRKDTTLDYLDRAEKEGKTESFWKRIKNNVVEITQVLTVEEKRKRTAERMLEALRISKDPALRKKAMQERQAARAAEKLRDILDGHPEKKRGRHSGLSM